MPKVLIVDDHETVRALTARWLTRKGYQVLEAGDGALAVELAGSELPDLILMDVGLPKLSGVEATRMLRADERTRSIPVVALTGHEERDQPPEFKDAGWSDYLVKPVSFAKLLSTVECLLAA